MCVPSINHSLPARALVADSGWPRRRERGVVHRRGHQLKMIVNLHDRGSRFACVCARRRRRCAVRVAGASRRLDSPGRSRSNASSGRRRRQPPRTPTPPRHARDMPGRAVTMAECRCHRAWCPDLVWARDEPPAHHLTPSTLITTLPCLIVFCSDPRSRNQRRAGGRGALPRSTLPGACTTGLANRPPRSNPGPRRPWLSG